MKVVVLGGTGEIGSYLCPGLVLAGHKVVAISDKEDEAYFEAETKQWKEIHRVVLDRQSLEDESEGLFGAEVAKLSPDVVIDTSCVESAHSRGLVNALKGTGLKLFIHCGTLHVYSPTQKRPWKEEHTRGYPGGPFAAEQQKMEAFLMDQYKEHKFPATVLLLGEVIGRGWAPINFQGTHETIVFDALETGGKIMLPQKYDGSGAMQVVHATNVTQIIITCIAKLDIVIGKKYNVAMQPFMMHEYPEYMAKRVYKTEAILQGRPWFDFTYSLEKDGQSRGKPGQSMEAAEFFFRAPVAENLNIMRDLGVQFLDHWQALDDVVNWVKDAGERKEPIPEPKMPRPAHYTPKGKPEFIPCATFQGLKEGYYFRAGPEGLGYYLDLGPFMNWQASITRRVKMQEDAEKYLDYNLGSGKTLLIVVLWLSMFGFFFMFSETLQGMAVYMAWFANIFMGIPQSPPKPFTAQLRVNSTDGATLGTWHTLLPMKGYKAVYTDSEMEAAAKRCRTVLYLHGNAETRNYQAHKLKWWHESAKADVVTFDYRGFGDSRCGGKAFQTCMTEVALYEDAYMMFNWLTKPKSEKGMGIDPKCVVIHAHSLGTAVATRVSALLTKEKRAPGAIVLEAPFTSVWETVLTSPISPVSYLPGFIQDVISSVWVPKLYHRFEHKLALKDISSPILFLHGEKDQIVPSHMSSDLYKVREESSNLCEEEGKASICTDYLSLKTATHHNVMDQLGAKVKTLEFAKSVWGK